MVPLRGIEPRTFSLQVSCSTNWAMAAKLLVVLGTCTPTFSKSCHVYRMTNDRSFLSAETFGGSGWDRTNNARGGRFTVSWGYQFSYTSKILYNWQLACSTIVIGTIHPCNKLERDSVRYLGFIQFVSFTDLRRFRQVGVEPKTFYLTVPSKNTAKRDFTC